MDLGTTLSVAQTLFAALQCSELKEMCSIFGYKSQLDDLQRTVSTVKAVLRDAEIKQEVSHEAELWIQELKDAVYDADDLLDKFITLAEQKQLIKGGGKASKKVRLFFSRYNSLGVAYNMSQGVKKIRKKLDAIAINHNQFGFSVDSQSIRRRREETCSYVYEGNIIGREDDVEKIVGLLVDSHVQQDVSFLTIVGIGGLGKTALAQLVYNDARVKSAFPSRLWTCVSDHDQNQLNVEQILSQILASATGQKHEGSSKDWLQTQLREKLASNRYLLVLDDVWTENRNHWLKLVEFLLGDQRGSWIVVTTRSHETARVIGDGPTHVLQGLSKENSWRLFKKTAFGSEQSNPHDDFVKIGHEIVEGCARVPLAIRVAGSLLYGQDKIMWLSFQSIGLCNFKERKNDIMPVLKLSYQQLESPLKSCFAYCALFPKDFVIEKKLLLSLWMAQGYIVPLDDGQRMEDAAEEYFSILLRRCFFQDVEHDDYGEILSCKIHDLMHDIAQKVAGKEIVCIADSLTDFKDKKVRHLAHTNMSAQLFSTKNHIRSYVYVGKCYNKANIDQSSLEALIANWVCLRALDLSNSGIKSLPDSIGELLHLRYLDLEKNDDLEELPKSIINLYNLQTLKLSGCHGLKELPKDLMKLINLRILDITGCYRLSYMPRGMSKLTCLCMLTKFVLDNSSSSWKQWFDQLEELKKIKNLKGSLYLKFNFCENAAEVKEDGIREGAYLRSKAHLNNIVIRFEGRGGDEEGIKLMEELQPHPNVKGLELCAFDDMIRMPRWARENNLVTSLPNLMRLKLTCCDMEYLTCLGNLPHLKYLKVEYIENLEYIIEDTTSIASTEPTASVSDGLSSAKVLLLFPCLVKLVLWCLPKLKGWKNLGVNQVRVRDNDQLHVDTDSSNMAPIPLPHLKSLYIQSCPNLISKLFCPNLEMIHLGLFNKRLQIIMSLSKEFEDEKAKATSSCTTTPSYSSSFDFHKLREVNIDNVAWLNSLPSKAFQGLATMRIWGDKEVKSLGEAGDVFRSCSSSLRFLLVENCPSLRRVVSGELEHLTALQDLRFVNCPNLSLSGEDEKEDGIGKAWSSLHHSLNMLILTDLPRLMNLPNWIQYLAGLQILIVEDCKGLESLPEWMPKLTSLKEFRLGECSTRLKERCQESTGEDWPHIQHIPLIKFN